MGIFSSIGGAISGISSAVSTASEEVKTPEALRKKHGFANFDTDMERLRNYDPAAELEKADAAPEEKTTTLPRQAKTQHK
jgi:hypothetical protein